MLRLILLVAVVVLIAVASAVLFWLYSRAETALFAAMAVRRGRTGTILLRCSLVTAGIAAILFFVGLFLTMTPKQADAKPIGAPPALAPLIGILSGLSIILLALSLLPERNHKR